MRIITRSCVLHVYKLQILHIYYLNRNAKLERFYWGYLQLQRADRVSKVVATRLDLTLRTNWITHESYDCCLCNSVANDQNGGRVKYSNRKTRYKSKLAPVALS